MRKLAILSILLVLVAGAFAADASEKDKIKAAKKAAETWLQLVDTQQYDKSWDFASDMFKQAVTKEKWAETMKDGQGKIGRPQFRSLKTSKYTTTIENAPPGEYVQLEYTADFPGRKGSIEAVTVSLGKDNAWHVTGYYVK